MNATTTRPFFFFLLAIDSVFFDPAEAPATGFHLKPIVFVINYCQFGAVMDGESICGFFQWAITHDRVRRDNDGNLPGVAVVQGNSRAGTEENGENEEAGHGSLGP